MSAFIHAPEDLPKASPSHNPEASWSQALEAALAKRPVRPGSFDRDKAFHDLVKHTFEIAHTQG